jgi:kumamolisin
MAPPGESLHVTVVLSRAAQHKATARRALAAFARAHRLTIVRSRQSPRTISLSGTSANLGAAFGVTRVEYASSLGTFYGHSGAVYIPVSLARIVDGVIGMNEFPVRRVSASSKREKRKVTKGSRSYHPFQMADLYNFPRDADGRGQTVALIELGGGFTLHAIRAYFTKLKRRVPRIDVVRIDDAMNRAGKRGECFNDLEVQGDIETLGSVAPGARIVVYIAPMTELGLYDAVTAAIHEKRRRPSIISISFGEVELYWPPRTLRLLNEALAEAASRGITVVCAAGDSGSSGGVPGGKPHVYFPASSPSVLACGGTELETRGDTIVHERVWRDGRRGATGGGVSRVFTRPPWQNRARVPRSPNRQLRHGRGLPDVAANAADYVLSADGKTIVIGGTSAVAPLWAGLIARINQRRKRPVGFLNPMLYRNYDHLVAHGAIRQITHGSNGTYRARKGWNPCAGLGSPDGARLAEHLFHGQASSSKSG